MKPDLCEGRKLAHRSGIVLSCFFTPAYMIQSLGAIPYVPHMMYYMLANCT